MNGKLLSVAAVHALVLTITTSIPAQASEAILALERQNLARFCSEIQFLDGFVTEVNANGDRRPDYLVNMQRLRCDGQPDDVVRHDGDALHDIWLQRADGGFDLAYDHYAHEVVFDRPGNTSFKVTTRDGTRRESLDGEGGATSASAEGATATQSDNAPSDRWIYRDSPAPAAVIGPADARMSLTCEAGAVRLRYSGWWVFDGDGINSHTREWDQSEHGIVPTFAVAGHETDVAVRLDDGERMLVARQKLPLSASLLDALASGNFVTVIYGGSLEEELQFPLRDRRQRSGLCELPARPMDDRFASTVSTADWQELGIISIG